MEGVKEEMMAPLGSDGGKVEALLQELPCHLVVHLGHHGSVRLLLHAHRRLVQPEPRQCPGQHASSNLINCRMLVLKRVCGVNCKARPRTSLHSCRACMLMCSRGQCYLLPLQGNDTVRTHALPRSTAVQQSRRELDACTYQRY